MWVNAWERKPAKDGWYLVQTPFGDVRASEFTVGGGWNTHREPDGELWTKYRINETNFVRWYAHEEPGEVPTWARRAYRKETWGEVNVQG